jgi:hypothetical protein
VIVNLRAKGSRECVPDDRPHEAIQKELSSSGLTGRSSTLRPLDLSSTPPEYWVARSSRATTAESVVRSRSSNTTPRSRGAKRPSCARTSSLEKSGGRRESRVPAAPAALSRPYSITSSARSKKDSGIVKPSALAVVRLMTRSNLVGCCTGKSAGFVPRRILSTKSPACRNRSAKFAP